LLARQLLLERSHGSIVEASRSRRLSKADGRAVEREREALEAFHV